MKNFVLILISIIGLAAILSTNKDLIVLMRMVSISWEDNKIDRQQQNFIYKQKVERLCVFPSGYAPTVSGKMFNLNKYNLALKDTIFDVKKDVVYGAWHYVDIDDEYRQEFPELRPNGIRYEVVNNQCYVADIILPLTFDHQSHKISVGGADWNPSPYPETQYSIREDFFSHICLKKSCERKPPKPIPPHIAVKDIRNPKAHTESFEDERFPDVIFYADFALRENKDRFGKIYDTYTFYTLNKISNQTRGKSYRIRQVVDVETKSTLDSQEKQSFFKSSVFENQVKPNTIFYRKISGDNSFDFYIDGGSIEVESFSTNVLPIMNKFVQAVQAYPQQFVSEGESQ